MEIAWTRMAPIMPGGVQLRACIVADMTDEKVLKVIDRGTVPIPKGDIDFEETEATPRRWSYASCCDSTAGAGLQDPRRRGSWQNWRFRFRLDARVGPVINSRPLSGS